VATRPSPRPGPRRWSPTRELARRGFAAGPSSGLNLAGARRLARGLGPGHHVATVCCDRMERYFSTDLFDDLRPRP
jgi:cysteine synthase A